MPRSQAQGETALRLKQRFINVFVQVGVVSWAAQKVGISRMTVYRWQREDTGFAEAFEEAPVLGA